MYKLPEAVYRVYPKFEDSSSDYNTTIKIEPVNLNSSLLISLKTVYY